MTEQSWRFVGDWETEAGFFGFNIACLRHHRVIAVIGIYLFFCLLYSERRSPIFRRLWLILGKLVCLLNLFSHGWIFKPTHHHLSFLLIFFCLFNAALDRWWWADRRHRIERHFGHGLVHATFRHKWEGLGGLLDRLGCHLLDFYFCVFLRHCWQILSSILLLIILHE